MGWEQQGKKQLPVRMPAELHAWIKATARELDVSMNELAVGLLAEGRIRYELFATAESVITDPYALQRLRDRLRER